MLENMNLDDMFWWWLCCLVFTKC